MLLLGSQCCNKTIEFHCLLPPESAILRVYYEKY